MSVSNPYVAPGISITELPQPSTPISYIASDANICLVAPSGSSGGSAPTYTQNAITVTDTVLIGTSGAAVQLPTIWNLNSDAVLVDVVSVTNNINPMPQPYVASTDYTVATGEAGPDGTAGTITPVVGGAFYNIETSTWIPTLINITYTYYPSDYWNPVVMYDMTSVQSRFGNIWNTTTLGGATYYSGINSPMSLAASLAFQNGAQYVICQPLFVNDDNGNPSIPAESDLETADPWQDTLLLLRQYNTIDILVPVIGVDGIGITNSTILSVFEAIQSYQAYQIQNNNWILAIFGEDGTASSTQYNTTLPPTPITQTHALELQSNFGNAISQYNVLINNTVFQMAVPGALGGSISVGGQYAAAAVAGSLSGRATSSSMTRQYISGFSGMTDPRTPSDKNNDAAAGLFVLENINGGIRCRQGITIDIVDGPAYQEISVVRSNIVVMASIQQTLDNDIIGQIIADANAPLTVQSAITGVLTILQDSETIVSFGSVTASLSTTSPTTIIASFTYAPAFPVNYVDVSFTLDLSSGSTTVAATSSSATTS